MLLLLAEMGEGRGFLFLDRPAHFLENTLCHCRIEQGFTTRNRFKRPYQFLATDLLQNIAGSSGADRREEHLVFSIGSQHQHTCFRKTAGDFFTGFDSGSSRQADIHYHHIRMVICHLFEGFTCRRGFPDDIKLRVAFQQRFQAKPDNFVIIYQ